MRGGTAIGIGRKLTNPSTFSISRQTLAPFSTSSNGGGRGRGRGGALPQAPSLINFLSEQFPKPDSDSPTSDPILGAGHGHGRGKLLSQSPSSSSSGIQPGSSAGRGQGIQVQPPGESREAADSGVLKKPLFFRRQDAEENADLMTSFDGAGRGRMVSAPAVQSVEEKRHIGAPVEPVREPRKPKLSREEAVKQAMGILRQDGGEGPEVDFGGGVDGGRGGERMGRGGGGGGERMMRGRGGGRGRGRGRGRGGRGRSDREGDRRRDEDGGGIASGLYLGDNPDGGEKLAKRVGLEVMNQLNEAFEELGSEVLPSPAHDAYVDAFHTNCMVRKSVVYVECGCLLSVIRK